MGDAIWKLHHRGLLALLLFIPISLHAQNGGGEAKGHIFDPQGRVVVHAEVILRNTLSGAALTAETNDAGEYSFSSVAPGEYILTASATGLAMQTRPIQVKSGEPEPSTDLTLPLATAEQSVTVVSASRVEELQQDSPLPVDVVTRQRIERTGSENAADVLGELPVVVTRLGLIVNIRGNLFSRWLVSQPTTAVTHEQAYALWNIYGPKEIKYGLQAYAAIDNLANSRDSLLWQNPPTYDRTDYGRTFRIGVRYTFPRE